MRHTIRSAALKASLAIYNAAAFAALMATVLFNHIWDEKRWARKKRPDEADRQAVSSVPNNLL